MHPISNHPFRLISTFLCSMAPRQRRQQQQQQQPRSSTFLFVLFLLLFQIHGSKGDIIVPQSSCGTVSYPSQPAGFGMSIGPGFFAYAHLQMINDDEYLCGGKDDISPSDYANNYGLLYYKNDANDKEKKLSSSTLRNIRKLSLVNSTFPDNDTNNLNFIDSLFHHHSGNDTDTIQEAEEKHNSKGKQKKKNSTIIDPPDEFPVVLLAKRGKCTYKAKAKTAMAISPNVKYIIVIAFPGSFEDEYIVMEADDPHNINVGLFYVSYNTGGALKNAIKSETKTQEKDGGIIVALNGVDPPDGLYDSSQKFMLATLAGFFLFISFFGCCMMCCQSTYIYRNGTTITIGFRPDDDTGPDGRVRENPLLTPEQVTRLPEIEYKGETLVTLDQPLEMASTAATSTIESAASNSTSLTENRDPSTNVVDSQVEINRTNNDAVTKSLHENLSSNTSCSICLEDFEVGEKLRVLPCNHLFHLECIQPWLTERYPNCPLCKSIVSAVDLDDSETMSNDSRTTNRRCRREMRLPNWMPSWLSNRIPVETNDEVGTNEENQLQANDSLQTPLMENTQQQSSNAPSRHVV